jgi:hypothetical protein
MMKRLLPVLAVACMAEQEPGRYPRVALRWHARYCKEHPHMARALWRPVRVSDAPGPGTCRVS